MVAHAARLVILASMVMRLAFLYLQHLCISTTMLCAVATHFCTASVFIEIDVKVMVS